MKYVYPAIFEIADEGGFVVSFPDLPGCYSQGVTLGEAFSMAQSALTQWLEYLMDKKLSIPSASGIADLKYDGEGFVNLVLADVKDGRAVQRSVSIPKWMDDKVIESGLSLSRVLQDALLQKLGRRLEDVRKELFASEELAVSDLRVVMMMELVNARKERGISQKRLEELSGVKQSIIARMEKGSTSPQIDTVLKVLVPLGKTLAIVPLEK